MADSKPLGQTYHEEVEALKSHGVSNPDAIRQVADKHGKNVNAVRGGIHQYRSRHLAGANASGGRRRRSGRTVDDLLANARAALEQALALVDAEVEQAKGALDEAQARYEAAVAGVADKKADIEKKLKALK
jgi:transposase-like protein